jgi:hypothetical protein
MFDSQLQFIPPSKGGDDRYSRKAERGFDAEVDGQLVMFRPSSPYTAKQRRDDEETIWLAFVGEYTDERVKLRRRATNDAVIEGYRAARHVRSLSRPVRRLHEIATVIYSGENWYDEAAVDLGVSPEDIASWMKGQEPPDWLAVRILDLTPRIAYAKRRHEWLAELAGAFLDGVPGYDDTNWCYPEPARGPDDF